MKGEKTVSPFTIPAVPQRNRSYALRSSPGSPISAGARASLHITLFQRHIRCCMKISRRRRVAPVRATRSASLRRRAGNPGSRRKRLTRATLPADGWKPVAPVSAAPPGRTAVYTTRAYCSITCSSTFAPASTCSGDAYSISLWLIPSLQGIKIIPVGAR